MLWIFNPAKSHQNKVYSYEKYLPELNTKDIEMPMATKDIKKVEKKNPDYIIPATLMVQIYNLEG